MRKYLLIGVVLGLALMTLGWGGAADEVARKDETKALRKAVQDYTAALNKGDLEKLLSFWTADADFIDENGKLTQGREALAALLKENLATLKGSKMKFEITQLRFPRPDVAVEDGFSVQTSESGDSEKARYNAVWVKTNGRWLLSSVREQPPLAAANAPAGRLQELEWLVGEWVPDNKEIGLTVNFRWVLNKRFLKAEYVAKDKDGEDMMVTKFVGWDPLTGQLRSWVFDSMGGLGNGQWSREGNTWTIDAEGILPDGRTGSAVNTIKFVNAKSFIWRSTDRQIDGEPAADSEVTFVRK